jgi:hypothetical protein
MKYDSGGFNLQTETPDGHVQRSTVDTEDLKLIVIQILLVSSTFRSRDRLVEFPS